MNCNRMAIGLHAPVTVLNWQFHYMPIRKIRQGTIFVDRNADTGSFGFAQAHKPADKIAGEDCKAAPSSGTSFIIPPLDPGANYIFTAIFCVSFGTPGCAAMPKASSCAAVPFRAPWLQRDFRYYERVPAKWLMHSARSRLRCRTSFVFLLKVPVSFCIHLRYDRSMGALRQTLSSLFSQVLFYRFVSFMFFAVALIR